MDCFRRQLKKNGANDLFIHFYRVNRTGPKIGIFFDLLFRFVFVATQVDLRFGVIDQPADVFAVGVEQQQGDQAAEDDQRQGSFAEETDYEDGESDTGTHRTGRDVVCRGKYDDEYDQTEQYGSRIDPQHGTGQCCNALTSFEVGKNGEDMSDHCGSDQSDFQVEEGIGAVLGDVCGVVVTGQMGEGYGDEAFQNVDTEDRQGGAGTQYSECVCSSCVVASVFADIDAVELASDPYGARNGT